jgi:hypothetical protein|tara:strand:- start:2997 stop:3242 length:246 start_codon:yes stop_codon:yes gene_type:complete
MHTDFEQFDIDELEVTIDAFDSPIVQNVFLVVLNNRRKDLVEELIDNGSDSIRHKIKMIDEIFDFIKDVKEELKTRKSLAN